MEQLLIARISKPVLNERVVYSRHARVDWLSNLKGNGEAEDMIVCYFFESGLLNQL